MTRKAPAGAKHAGCIDHISHDAGPKGWLCVTTNTEDRNWPRVEKYRPQGFGAEGPFLPAADRDIVPVDRAADMRAFADHIAIVRAEHRALELARLAVPALRPAEYAETVPVPSHRGATMRLHPLPAGAGGSQPLPWDSAEDRAARARMGAELDARKGRAVRAIAPIMAAAPVRKARKVAPEPDRHLIPTYRGRGFTHCAQAPTARDIPAPDHLGALAVLTHAGGTCSMCIEYCARGLEPEPAPVADALAYCNACDRPSAELDTASGYCRDCIAAIPAEPVIEACDVCGTVGYHRCAADVEAIAEAKRIIVALPEPAPVTRKRRAVRRRRPIIRASRARELAAYLAPVTVEPIAEPTIAPSAPVAPATAVPAAAIGAERPTCPRCAQVFRVKGSGLAWHLANRPDCAGPIAAAIPAPAVTYSASIGA